MNMLMRSLECLNHHRIRYVHSIHEPAFTARQVAAAENMPAHEIAKTVVYIGDNGMGMLVLPGDSIVDFGEVMRLLGLSVIRLATEPELTRAFQDCELGAMPPLGNLFGMPVLVDNAIAAELVIAFNAGTHMDVIHMSFADYRDLINPLIASFAVKERLAAAM
jgi:Ala-tRNA(Pro) deacylase